MSILNSRHEVTDRTVGNNSKTPFQRWVVSIIITLDALLESAPLGTAAGLRTRLHLYYP